MNGHARLLDFAGNLLSDSRFFFRSENCDGRATLARQFHGTIRETLRKPALRASEGSPWADAEERRAQSAARQQRSSILGRGPATRQPDFGVERIGRDQAAAF